MATPTTATTKDRTVREVRRCVRLARVCRRYGDPQQAREWMAQAMAHSRRGLAALYSRRALAHLGRLS